MKRTLRTSLGWRLAQEPARARRGVAELLALVDQVDREADEALAAGNVRRADRLTWEAHGLRAAAAVRGAQ